MTVSYDALTKILYTDIHKNISWYTHSLNRPVLLHNQKKKIIAGRVQYYTLLHDSLVQYTALATQSLMLMGQ